MACGKLLVALLLQSHHSHTILQPLLELWSYASEYAFVSHIIISSQCRVNLSICGLCSLCALDTLMDCRDARRFIAAAKDPLASIRPVLVDQWFLTDTRAEAIPEPLEDPLRCRARVGKGRCRKRVSGLAITQYCCKHQQGRSPTEPGDLMVEWALRGVPPQEADEYVGERDAQQRYHGKGTLRGTGGEVHQGCFLHGRLHGMGRYTCPGRTYIGEFWLGKFHGRGMLTQFINRSATQATSQCYTGEFANGKKHGRGVEENANVDFFLAETTNVKKNVTKESSRMMSTAAWGCTLWRVNCGMQILGTTRVWWRRASSTIR